MMRACFDVTGAVSAVGYRPLALGAGGHVIVLRGLRSKEGLMATKLSPGLEIDYRLWYIKEELDKPRLSRQSKQELREEVVELEASLNQIFDSLADRLAAAADRMDASLDQLREMKGSCAS